MPRLAALYNTPGCASRLPVIMPMLFTPYRRSWVASGFCPQPDQLTGPDTLRLLCSDTSLPVAAILMLRSPAPSPARMWASPEMRPVLFKPVMVLPLASPKEA